MFFSRFTTHIWKNKLSYGLVLLYSIFLMLSSYMYFIYITSIASQNLFATFFGLVSGAFAGLEVVTILPKLDIKKLHQRCYSVIKALCWALIAICLIWAMFTVVEAVDRVIYFFKLVCREFSLYFSYLMVILAGNETLKTVFAEQSSTVLFHSFNLPLPVIIRFLAAVLFTLVLVRLSIYFLTHEFETDNRSVIINSTLPVFADEKAEDKVLPRKVSLGLLYKPIP